jgi:hypothetical protein
VLPEEHGAAVGFAVAQGVLSRPARMAPDLGQVLPPAGVSNVWYAICARPFSSRMDDSTAQPVDPCDPIAGLGLIMATRPALWSSRQ